MRNRSLKILGLVGAAGVLLIAPVSIAVADDPTDTPTPTLYSNDQGAVQSPAPQDGQMVIAPAPNNQNGDDENGRPPHRIREEEHGIEGIQLSIVIGAVIIAAGIAIGISRSRTVK